MANIKIAQSVEELEAAYKVPKGEGERYNIDKNNIPQEFWVLLPYIEYFCPRHQEDQDELYDSLPEQAFADLDQVLNSLYPTVDLGDWIGKNNFKDKPNSEEWYALQLLSQMNEERRPRIYEEPKGPGESEMAVASEILKLDEAGLRKRWNLPDTDSYKRYLYDPSLYSEPLKPLVHLIHLFAIEDESNMTDFMKQFNQNAIDEIQMVKRSLYHEMLTFDGRSEATNYRVSKEASVLFRLRKYPDFV